jgi:hypothetical protein
MFAIGNFQIKFEPNYPGLVAVTSTVATASSVISAAVNNNPIFSLQNIALVVISVGSWGYALAAKSSKVFVKTMKTDLAPAKQSFPALVKEWTVAKKNTQEIQKLWDAGDLCDGNVLTEEIEKVTDLETQLYTLFNTLNKDQQESYRHLLFQKESSG